MPMLLVLVELCDECISVTMVVSPVDTEANCCVLLMLTGL